MDEELIDDWMDLADENSTSNKILFGDIKGQGSQFVLFPVYKQYFETLSENLRLMRIQRIPENEEKQFSLFINELEQYLEQTVFKGESDYEHFLGQLQILYNKHQNCQKNYERICKLYQQPSLTVYIKPQHQQKVLIQKPLLSIVTNKIPELMTLPKIKDLFKDYKQLPAINVVLVGQVDHGKSTLMGRILKDFNYLNSKNDQSVGLTAFTDIYQTEKQKGKTLEFSKYTLEMDKYKLNLFDTPGHRNYSANMIMAMRIADLVILTVSAKKGEFEAGFNGGTIKQILTIANALQITNLTVIVNKMETINWRPEEFAKIKTQISQYVILSRFCFQIIEYIAIDSLSGKNFEKKIFKMSRTLHSHLSNLTPPIRKTESDLRMPVFDYQQVYGSLQIFCKIQSGFIHQDMQIKINPSQCTTQIINILKEGAKIPYATCGEFVTVVLKNYENPRRGDILSCKQTPLLTDQIMCQFTCLEQMLVSGFECIIHLHEIVEVVEVDILSIHKDNKYLKSNFLRENNLGFTNIRFKRLVALEKGHLGNFVLRNGTKTLGFGKVVKVKKNY